MLAYRNLKKNKGSKTAGVDKKTITHLEKWEPDKLIGYIQKRFEYYVAQPVRRVEIPKSNGKTRPLGIPTIMDRLIQQCVLQILEPICEAKFFKRNNGFRPNRGAEHAISQAYKFMQGQHLHWHFPLQRAPKKAVQSPKKKLRMSRMRQYSGSVDRS